MWSLAYYIILDGCVSGKGEVTGAVQKQPRLCGSQAYLIAVGLLTRRVCVCVCVCEGGEACVLSESFLLHA